MSFFPTEFANDWSKDAGMDGQVLGCKKEHGEDRAWELGFRLEDDLSK